MGQDNINKILEIFYEYPNRRFTIREISKLTKIPRATAHKNLVFLKKENLVTEDNMAQDNFIFRIQKINYFIENIVKSNLISEIAEKLNPSCIILFGSVRRGESVKESDVDIFIESSIRKNINIKKFEKFLKHPIQLFIESDINNLSNEMFNNVINGIKIFGSIKIK